MQKLHTLDARGCPCPQPLIKTRRLWKTLQPGQRFQVLVDNDIAHLNLISFLGDQNANPEVQKEDEDWVIMASRTGNSDASPTLPDQPEAVIPVQAPVSDKSPLISNYIVVLKSDQMGMGDPDLGRILIKGYLNALCELDSKPSTIILYNGGVKLAAKDSGAETALAALANEHIDIIVCGACIDYYNLQDSLAAGRISNMYEIAEKIAQTGHVVYP